MKKDRVRISLDVSKELSDQIKKEADEKDMTVNAVIRHILAIYFYNKENG